MHVDNLNSGGENIPDCYNIYSKAKTSLDQGSFNLRKFQSNLSDFEYMINGEINHNSIVTKVLGLIWDKDFCIWKLGCFDLHMSNKKNF